MCYLCFQLSLDKKRHIIQLWLHIHTFLAHMCVCTVGSYASLSVCPPVRPSVCLSLTGPKFRLDKNSLDQNSYGQLFLKKRLDMISLTLPFLLTQAGGLTSTSSCILFYKNSYKKITCVALMKGTLEKNHNFFDQGTPDPQKVMGKMDQVIM